jgi:hypothetical protein
MKPDSNSTELSPSWETNSCSATPIFIILWSPKIHCRIHKSPLLVPIHSQRDAVDIFTSYLFKVYLILSSSHLLLNPSSRRFPSGISSCHMHATCPAYLVLLNLITVINIWRGVPILELLVLLASLLLFALSSAPAPSFQTPSVSFSFNLTWEIKFHSHTKPYARLYFCIF